MKDLVQLALTYSGEALVGLAAFIIRHIEIKLLVRKKRKEWEAGETYSKFEGKPDKNR
jgi:hypothetical protein